MNRLIIIVLTLITAISSSTNAMNIFNFVKNCTRRPNLLVACGATAYWIYNKNNDDDKNRTIVMEIYEDIQIITFVTKAYKDINNNRNNLCIPLLVTITYEDSVTELDSSTNILSSAEICELSDKIELTGYQRCRNSNDDLVILSIKNSNIEEIKLDSKIKKRISTYLCHDMRDSTRDCFDFVNEVSWNNQTGCFSGCYNLIKQCDIKIGDSVGLMNERGEFKHYAIALGNNRFLSKFGMGGYLLVSDLKTMQDIYNCNHIALLNSGFFASCNVFADGRLSFCQHYSE